MSRILADERHWAGLIGRTVHEVHYFEREDSYEHWSSHARFDSIDFGLDLIMADGGVFGIIWEDHPDFHIKLLRESIAQEVPSVARRDVTHRAPRWGPLVGQAITHVRGVWTDPPDRDDPCLLDVELRFERGARVYLSLNEPIFEGDMPSPDPPVFAIERPSIHLMLFGDLDDACAFGWGAAYDFEL